MRLILCAALACVACSEDGVSQRTRHERAAAARAGLYALQAAPGGALARFVDVRLIGADVVCGIVDGQDGAPLRHFAVVRGGEAVVEQPGDPVTRAKVTRMCTGGPSRKVISRNQAYTDISVEDDPS